MTISAYSLTNLPTGFHYDSSTQLLYTPRGSQTNNQKKFAGKVNIDGSVKNGGGIVYPTVDFFVNYILDYMSDSHSNQQIFDIYYDKYKKPRIRKIECLNISIWNHNEVPSYEQFEKTYLLHAKIKKIIAIIASIMLLLASIAAVTCVVLYRFKII